MEVERPVQKSRRLQSCSRKTKRSGLRRLHHTDASEDLMRDPTRKRQKEWSFEPPMRTVDRGQLRLSAPSELCAWRSAPEQQIAIQRQGKWHLSPCHKLRPLPMSRQGQRRCCDE